jgi:hypothetical protein
VMLRRARQSRRARVESELRVEIAVIAVGVTAEAGMDVAADATGTVAEIVRHVVVVNGRQRHRGRMRDVWMRCVSGLLRADRGSQRVRTRL